MVIGECPLCGPVLLFLNGGFLMMNFKKIMYSLVLSALVMSVQLTAASRPRGADAAYEVVPTAFLNAEEASVDILLRSRGLALRVPARIYTLMVGQVEGIPALSEDDCQTFAEELWSWRGNPNEDIREMGSIAVVDLFLTMGRSDICNAILANFAESFTPDDYSTILECAIDTMRVEAVDYLLSNNLARVEGKHSSSLDFLGGEFDGNHELYCDLKAVISRYQV